MVGVPDKLTRWPLASLFAGWEVRWEREGCKQAAGCIVSALGLDVEVI